MPGQIATNSYREASARVGELAAEAGQADVDVDVDVERSTLWTDEQSAGVYVAAGATLFTTEIRASDGGYDFGTVERLVAWRDARR